MIGWLNDTHGFRQIVIELMDDEGLSYSDLITKTKKAYDKHKVGSTHLKPADFQEIMKAYWSKCVFWKWFTQNFGEPSAWYRARLAYARTFAVMSMVGSIVGYVWIHLFGPLGAQKKNSIKKNMFCKGNLFSPLLFFFCRLGDRHGENILFDSTNGDCCHVDLNCLFYKGLQFPQPERVPFRLTKQLVDALGLTGYDGIYRKSCEFTMHTIRKHQRALLAVLETLVHDPLCDWSKNLSSQQVRNN